MSIRQTYRSTAYHYFVLLLPNKLRIDGTAYLVGGEITNIDSSPAYTKPIAAYTMVTNGERLIIRKETNYNYDTVLHAEIIEIDAEIY